MEDEKRFQEAIKRLTSTTEKWNAIKTILEDEIQENQALISFIDKIVKEKEDKISKLN